MADSICAGGISGDLFGDSPIPERIRSSRPVPTAELMSARVLCRQFRQQQARPAKQRIAHLICLNLLSMLKRDSQARQRKITENRLPLHARPIA